MLKKIYGNNKGEALGDKLIFPTSMYNTIWGSLLICAYMFSEQPINTNNLKCKWLDEERKITKGLHSKLQEFHPKDDSFINDVLGYFNIPLPNPNNFPIALIEGPYNWLFVPLVNGELLPLREDGIPSRTIIFAMHHHNCVYPIKFNPVQNQN